jgi:hypothetical protein
MENVLTRREGEDSFLEDKNWMILWKMYRSTKYLSQWVATVSPTTPQVHRDFLITISVNYGCRFYCILWTQGMYFKCSLSLVTSCRVVCVTQSSPTGPFARHVSGRWRLLWISYSDMRIPKTHNMLFVCCVR